MKRLNLFLIISILIGILGCEKEDPKTTYSFKNNSSQMLYGFSTYYWDGSNSIDQKNHGNLGLGQETEHFETDNPQINFSFSFDPNGIVYVCVNPYSVNAETHNNFVIDNYTIVYGGTTYYVLNSSSGTLYDFASYFWTGTQIIDYVEHGTLQSGYRTVHVQTNRNAIYMGFTLTPGGDVYILEYPFSITANTINPLVINDQTNVYHSDTKSTKLKSSSIYLSKNYKKYKLIDLLNNNDKK